MQRVLHAIDEVWTRAVRGTPRDHHKLLEARVASRLAAGPLRIVIGASGISDQGWIPTEYRYLDITRGENWARIFEENTIDAILAEHVWEHLTPEDGQTALAFCHKYLRPGGYARIAVPDGLNPNKEYIDWVKPGGIGPGAEDHKVLYSHDVLSSMGEAEGFRVEKLEFWDQNGQFRYVGWDPALGMVRRSRRFDPRNREGKLGYTSLILDFFKLRSKPKVYVVIPVFNRVQQTLACVSRLESQTFSDLEIIVSDGASTDGTPDAVRGNHPSVHVISSGSELWWGGATRAGIDHAFKLGARDDEFMLLLNDDTKFDNDLVAKLVGAATKYNAVIGASVGDDPQGTETLDYGARFDKERFGFLPIRNPEWNADGLYLGNDALPARATLVPVWAVRKAGNVDSVGFPHYLSDYEFTYRLKTKAGSLMGVICDAIVRTDLSGPVTQHHHAQGFGAWLNFSYGDHSKRCGRARINFILKHAPYRRAPFLIMVQILRSLPLAGFYLREDLARSRGLPVDDFLDKRVFLRLDNSPYLQIRPHLIADAEEASRVREVCNLYRFNVTYRVRCFLDLIRMTTVRTSESAQ